MEQKRETLKSRLGFILLSAGCAIGLGNVWRFPYITGKYGGGAFVLIYVAFLLLLGLPIMVMEFSIGRKAKCNMEPALEALEPPATKWHRFGHVAIAGNYLLMMFYTTISGWLIIYFLSIVGGDLPQMAGSQSGAYFSDLLSSWPEQALWMAVAIIIGFAVSARGLQRGVEKATKVLMTMLLALVVILAVNSLTLDGAKEGLAFYLKPDFGKMRQYGIGEVVFAAMGQAFFTLSIGMGGMEIFGSYTGNDKSLTSESLTVIGLDAFVALMSGLIIFPACFTYQVNPGAGPSLLFVTLPNIFNQMAGGRLWGTLFFLFMVFAALTTLIAVFENIVSYWIDVHHADRKKVCLYNCIALIILSLPCILGFNVLSSFQPLGEGTAVLDLEDFLISNTIMPLGALVLCLFCTSKRGWGWSAFKEEADKGKGLRFFSAMRFYCTYLLPLLIAVIFIKGYYDIFSNIIG